LLAVILELWLRSRKIAQKKHEKPHSERIDKALGHFRTNKTKKITGEEWQKVAKTSPTATTHDLAHLIGLGILEKFGKEHSTHYKFKKHK